MKTFLFPKRKIRRDTKLFWISYLHIITLPTPSLLPLLAQVFPVWRKLLTIIISKKILRYFWVDTSMLLPLSALFPWLLTIKKFPRLRLFSLSLALRISRTDSHSVILFIIFSRLTCKKLVYFNINIVFVFSPWFHFSCSII